MVERGNKGSFLYITLSVCAKILFLENFNEGIMTPSL